VCKGLKSIAASLRQKLNRETMRGSSAAAIIDRGFTGVERAAIPQHVSIEVADFDPHRTSDL
jgi:hypothetical protein